MKLATRSLTLVAVLVALALVAPEASAQRGHYRGGYRSHRDGGVHVGFGYRPVSRRRPPPVTTSWSPAKSGTKATPKWSTARRFMRPAPTLAAEPTPSASARPAPSTCRSRVGTRPSPTASGFRRCVLRPRCSGSASASASKRGASRSLDENSTNPGDRSPGFFFVSGQAQRHSTITAFVRANPKVADVLVINPSMVSVNGNGTPFGTVRDHGAAAGESSAAAPPNPKPSMIVPFSVFPELIGLGANGSSPIPNGRRKASEGAGTPIK